MGEGQIGQGAAASATASAVRPGQMLFDEYRVEGLLGEGGYGAVHLVSSQLTGERFALKRALVEDGAGRTDLLEELKAWMNLPPYPLIAACRFFRISGDAVYIFAEYVEGGSLEDGMRSGRLYQGESATALARIMEIAVQAAWGLEAAHQSGLIHQDVKPSNILLTADWTAKVADFGLTEKRQPDPQAEAVLDYILQDIQEEDARERAKGALRDQLKAPDQQEVRGRGAFSSSYASPEQLAGASVTRATDIWSWGITLLEVFNGKCTWEMGPEAVEALAEIAAGGSAVDGPPRLPPGAAAVIERCLRPEPGDRWQSMVEAAGALARVYEEVLGRPFPHSQPAAAEPAKTSFTRKLPSGSGWNDPRGWVAWAYSLAGKSAVEARLHFPDATGSITSRAVSDLEAFEHALQVAERIYDGGRHDIAGGLGQLHGNLGHVCAFLGDTAGALRHYDTCAALLAPSSNVEDQIGLATCWNSKAIALRKAGRAADSIRVCDEALAVWRGLEIGPERKEHDEFLAMLLGTKANAVDDPGEALRLRTEAVSLPGLSEGARAKYLASQAMDFGRLGEWEQYERTAAQAKEMMERLIRDERSFDLKGPLATLAMNCAQFESRRGQWSAALDHLNEAVERMQPLVSQEGQWELAEQVGDSYFEKGKALEALGRRLEALGAYRSAREMLSEIVCRGGRSDLARPLAGALRNEANLNRALGHTAEALRLSGDAVTFFRRLGQGEQQRAYLPLIARALAVHSGCLLEGGQAPEALAAARESVDLFRSLPAEDPERKSMEYADALMSFGVAARRAGDPQSTWSAYQEAIGILEAFDQPDALGLKALTLYNASNLLGDAGELATSLALLDKAIETWTGLRARMGPGFCQDDLVLAHKAKSNQLLKLGANEEALAASDETLPLLTGMVESGREDLRNDLGKLWGSRAVIFKKLGKLQESIDAFTQAAAILKTIPTRQGQMEPGQVAEFMLQEADNVKALGAFRPQDAAQWSARAEQTIQSATKMSMGGDPYHACELIDDAILIYSVMLDRQPDQRWVQALANTQLQKGIMAMYSHRDRGAEASFRAAAAGYDRLITEFRQSAELQNWGKACLALAVFLKSMGRTDESAAVMNQARARMRSLGKEQYQQWQRSADQLLQNT